MAKKSVNKESKISESKKTRVSKDESGEVDLAIAKEVFDEEPLAEDKKEAIFTEKFEEAEEGESLSVEKEEVAKEGDTEEGSSQATDKEKTISTKKAFRPAIFGLGMLSGVIVALIIFGVFYYFTSQEVCNSYNSTITSEKKLTSLIISQKYRDLLTSDNCPITLTEGEKQEVEGWQAITNPNYSYALNLPNDWIKSSSSTSEKMLFESPTVKLSIYSGDMASTSIPGFEVESTQTKKVGCVDAKITYSTDKSINAGVEKNKLVTAEFTGGGKAYKVAIIYPVDQGASLASDYSEAYNLLLKTFKFN